MSEEMHGVRGPAWGRKVRVLYCRHRSFLESGVAMKVCKEVCERHIR